MSDQLFPVLLPVAFVSRESVEASEPLLAFASERLATLEAQRDAIALSLVFEDHPLLGSFEFSPRTAYRGAQLGGESVDGELLFIPMECRAPLSEVSDRETRLEDDLLDWIDGLSERSVQRMDSPCFYRDETLPLHQALTKQALGRVGYQHWLANTAPSGPEAVASAGPVETLWTPARLRPADPDSVCLIQTPEAELLKALRDRVEWLEAQRSVFKLADFFEARPELSSLHVPSSKKPSAAHSGLSKEDEEELGLWAKTLPRRSRLAGLVIERPARGDLAESLMAAILPPAAFAQWQGTVLGSASLSQPSKPASGPRL